MQRKWTQISTITGITPSGSGEPINSGTLNGKRLDLSAEGSLVYIIRVAYGITDMLWSIFFLMKPR